MEDDVPNPRKRLYLVLGGVVVLVVAVAAVAAKPAYRWFSHWRALQMVEASAQALRDKDLTTAGQRADSAVHLWPWDARVTRQEAAVLTAEKSPNALAMWQQTWSLSHDVADLREVVATALEANNLPVAIGQFAVLQKAAPQSPATWFLEGKIRFFQKQWPEALAAFKKVLAAPNPPPDAILYYANAAIGSGDAVLIREGLVQLHTLTARTDELGLKALRLLGGYAKFLSAGDLAPVAEKLKSHPLATRDDKLLALNIESSLPGANMADLIKSARDLFPPNDPDALLIIGRWLNNQHQYADVLQLIDQPSAAAHEDLFLVRADALAAQGQWQTILNLLTSDSPKPPLPEDERELFEARALTELGQKAQAQIAWQRAFNTVANDPAKLYDMAVYAVKLKLDDYARPAFQQLLSEPQVRLLAYEQLIQLEHRARNTTAVHQLLGDMARLYPADIDVRSDLLYTGFLLGDSSPAQVESARQLVANSKLPYLAYRMTLALGLLTSGQPAEALKLFTDLPASTWPSGNPGWNAVYVGVLRANGQRETADTLEQYIKPDDLLPEEKRLLATPLPPATVK